MPTIRDMSPRELFESQLEQVHRVLSYICHRHCLLNEDGEDFRSWVMIRLIENDYRVFRRYRGKSRLSTYLTTVINNLARDYRIKKWGRWRPSAAAKRRGNLGVQIETLLYRDGYTFDEAVRILRDNLRVEETPEELADLVGKLPSRVRRGRAEPIDEVADGGAEARILRDAERSERAETAGKVKEVLARAIRGLDAPSRLILRLHFGDGLTLAAISREYSVDQRRLYTRMAKTLAALRGVFEENGLGIEEVSTVLDDPEFDLSVGLEAAGGGEIEKGPSKSMSRDHENGGETSWPARNRVSRSRRDVRAPRRPLRRSAPRRSVPPPP